MSPSQLPRRFGMKRKMISDIKMKLTNETSRRVWNFFPLHKKIESNTPIFKSKGIGPSAPCNS